MPLAGKCFFIFQTGFNVLGKTDKMYCISVFMADTDNGNLHQLHMNRFIYISVHSTQYPGTHYIIRSMSIFSKQSIWGLCQLFLYFLNNLLRNWRLSIFRTAFSFYVFIFQYVIITYLTEWNVLEIILWSFDWNFCFAGTDFKAEIWEYVRVSFT